jgi:hypothetical protein
MKKLAINHKHKFIYFEVTKAASRSILNALKDVGYDYINWDKYKPEWDNYFKFTFVRNPIDRIVSCYNFFFFNMGKGNRLYLEPYGLYPEMSFTAFLEAICDSSIEDNKHWIPQNELLFDKIFYSGDDNSIIFKMDFCLETKIKLLFETLDIKFNGLKHLNKSNDNFTRNMIDQYCLDLIFEKYKKDFELFNYKMEL